MTGDLERKVRAALEAVLLSEPAFVGVSLESEALVPVVVRLIEEERAEAQRWQDAWRAEGVRHLATMMQRNEARHALAFHQGVGDPNNALRRALAEQRERAERAEAAVVEARKAAWDEGFNAGADAALGKATRTSVENPYGADAQGST